jgi:hypothetical protein
VNRYRLTGHYGTFEIQRIVERADYDDAWAETGIMPALQAEGWEFTAEPDGEDWTIEMWVNGQWVEQDDPEFGG